MSWVDLCLRRSWATPGYLIVRLGVPMLDAYLEFLAVRSRPNTVVAIAYDLKVFFTVVGKPPAKVVAADVLAFVTAQHIGGSADRLQSGDAISASTARTRYAAAHGSSSARTSSPPRVRVLPPGVRPGLDAEAHNIGHPAIHRPVLGEEPADGRRHRIRAILTVIGVLDDVNKPDAPRRFVRRDGMPGDVVRPASVAADELPGPDERYVLQVSRWDRLKDMAGVMRGFAEHVAPSGPGHLILAGPAVDGVRDDPEGVVVYEECLTQWRRLLAEFAAE